MVKKIFGLSDVINDYDLFLIDIWGVLHNGLEPYAGAIEAIKKLQSANKKITLLSNTPRPSTETRENLLKMDFPLNEERIVTSGQFFMNEMSNPVIFNDLKKEKIYIMTNEPTHPLLKNISNDISVTTNMEEAKFCLIIAIADNEQEKQHFIEEINKLPTDVELLCPNPDKIAPYGNTLRTLGGYFAEIFANKGGKVHYFGKPHEPIYKYATHDFAEDKSRIIAIGDGMETDILGGYSFGIDTLLISKGIYMDENDISQVMKKYDFQPSFYSDYLKY